MTTMIRRLLAVCACALVLAACQVDVVVDMTMADDGTGTITVVATADADVVRAVPTIAEDLALDDVVAAGWVVDGPTPTPGRRADDLVLAPVHLGGRRDQPAEQHRAARSTRWPSTRTTVNSDTTNTMSGLLGLSQGFESFSDEDLVTAVGSVPFAEEIEASGATPQSSMSVTLRAALPGEIVHRRDQRRDQSTTGTIEWAVPMDGTIVELRAESRTGADQQRLVGAAAVDRGARGLDRLGGVHDVLHRLRRLGPVAPLAPLPPTPPPHPLHLRVLCGSVRGWGRHRSAGSTSTST